MMIAGRPKTVISAAVVAPPRTTARSALTLPINCVDHDLDPVDIRDYLDIGTFQMLRADFLISRPAGNIQYLIGLAGHLLQRFDHDGIDAFRAQRAHHNDD